MAMTDLSKLLEEEFLKQMMTQANPLLTATGIGAVDSASYPSHAHGVCVPANMQSGNNSSGDHTHTYSAAAQGRREPDRWGEGTLLKMLASRLRWNDGEMIPFVKVVTHKVTDKVVVIIVTKDDAVVINDDPDLYPSDALVTQVRLLAEAL